MMLCSTAYARHPKKPHTAPYWIHSLVASLRLVQGGVSRVAMLLEARRFNACIERFCVADAGPLGVLAARASYPSLVPL